MRKSVRFVVCFLELKSAMTLKIPGICSAANFPTSNFWNRIARALIMLDAIWDVLLRSLYNQATAGILSHQIATEQCCKSSAGIIVSSTSHCRRMPASSNSEIEIEPSGHSSVMSLAGYAGGPFHKPGYRLQRVVSAKPHSPDSPFRGVDESLVGSWV